MWAASPARNIRPKRIGSATKLRDALCERGAGDELVGRLLVDPALQFVPEALVRPLRDIVVERTLHIIAAAPGRAHGAERKSARVVGIDQLRADRPRLRQDAEPTERIDPLIGLDRRRLYAGAAAAMKTVAASDEVAFDLVADAIL